MGLTSAFGRISELVRRGDRERLREHVAGLRRMLDEASREGDRADGQR